MASAHVPTPYPKPSRPQAVFQQPQQHVQKTSSPSVTRLAQPVPTVAIASRRLPAVHASFSSADEEELLLQRPRPTFKPFSSTPHLGSSRPLPITPASEPTRPVLTSKFSSDNIASSTKRMATKAWLQNIASAARTSTFSNSGSISAGHPDPAPLSISNPEIEHQGSRRVNADLGTGARRVGKPHEAVHPHVYLPPSSPPARVSEDSVRSFTSCSSGRSYTTSTSSFSQSRKQDRALPLLPLRIDSLSDKDTAVERLASPPVFSQVSRSFRERQESAKTEDSIQLGQSALSRPATPEVPKRPVFADTMPKPSATATPTLSKKPSPPFRAVLSGPQPRYPPFLADTDRLVNLKVGDRTFTTSVASISAHPSHLKDFVEATLQASEAATARPSRLSTATPSSESEYSQLSAAKRPTVKSLRLPSAVTVHLPDSPVTAIRSARASIFGDVPSDEGEENEDLLDQLQAVAARQFLTVPPRVAHRQVSGSSSSSENPLLSFLDTTPDEEASNPFHFAFPVSSHQTASDDSEPPSLSSSPSSSAFQGRSPLTAGKMHESLSAGRPFDSFSARPMDITLDRSAEPYEAILHYLREGELPRSLTYSTSTALLSGSPSEDMPTRVQDMIKGIPPLMRPTLLPFLLHPTLSTLEDLRDEAVYLGLAVLQTKCEAELTMLRKLLDTKPNTLLNEQRKAYTQRAQSPVKRIRGEAGVDRPRLGAHRQYHSEASVVPASRAGQDGWI